MSIDLQIHVVDLLAAETRLPTQPTLARQDAHI